MAVTIRLARHGRRKAPFYRIVVANKDSKRDGRFLEIVGTLNPLTDPATYTLKKDRVEHWVAVGAKPSDTVANLITKEMPDYLEGIESKRRARIQMLRAKRKARQSARAAA